MSEFKLRSPFSPAGDQPNAIAELTDGVLAGDRFQTLLGITGSGKTRTVASVIENVQRPTLVMSHNKTLAAQLFRELSDFSPIIASNFLFPITTTINPKPISRLRINTSRKIYPSTKKFNGCDFVPLVPYCRVDEMWSSCRL